MSNRSKPIRVGFITAFSHSQIQDHHPPRAKWHLQKHWHFRKERNKYLGWDVKSWWIMHRKLHMWADGNHLPHRTTVATVRPEERYPWTADDGSESFCLPYTFSLCSSIPEWYRQIRGAGCNPNLHLFTQGWVGVLKAISIPWQPNLLNL